MPIETKRQAEVLKKLQDVIKHTDRDIAAGRKLAIKRWVETYVEHIKYFKDDKLEFLCLVFKDEDCWVKLDKDKPGTRLNNTFLGERLTEEKIDGIDNPLRMYEMACSYCVVDEIHQLFKERFKAYKKSFPSGAFKGKTEINEYVRKSLLGSMKRNGDVFNFWIDKESGKLKQPGNAAEGFDSAVKLKWSEGVEYFYNQLEKKDKEKEKKLTEAIIALSRVQSVEKDAPILDFCVRNIADKDTLLQNLLGKDKVVYSLFVRLIHSSFFDTVHDLVKCWCYEGSSVKTGEMFSHEQYATILSLISSVMLKNPESSVQARSIIMQIWECSRFDEHKETAVDASSSYVPIRNVLAGLIINWKRVGCKLNEKKEILGIISFARDSFPEKFQLFKESIIRNLRSLQREGMEKGIDYGNLAKELFSKSEGTHLPTYERDDGPDDHQEDAIETIECENNLDTSSDDAPQSTLGGPGVSGFSGLSK